MVTLDRLFRAVTILLVATLVVSEFPDRWLEVLLVFGIGIGIGNWSSSGERAPSDAAPLLPWNEMTSGERLTHFVGPLAGFVFGAIMFGMAVQFSRVSTEWQMMILAGVMMAGSLLYAAWKWTHRYAR